MGNLYVCISWCVMIDEVRVRVRLRVRVRARACLMRLEKVLLNFDVDCL